MFTTPSMPEFNPHNLPESMDFHKATKDLPLPRDVKVKFQTYLGRRTGEQIKNITGVLKQMLSEKLKEAKIGFKNNEILIPEKLVETKRRDLLREAIYTKAVIEFTEKYTQSLIMQKKI